jgi:hypothetical protein
LANARAVKLYRLIQSLAKQRDITLPASFDRAYQENVLSTADLLYLNGVAQSHGLNNANDLDELSSDELAALPPRAQQLTEHYIKRTGAGIYLTGLNDVMLLPPATIDHGRRPGPAHVPIPWPIGLPLIPLPFVAGKKELTLKRTIKVRDGCEPDEEVLVYPEGIRQGKLVPLGFQFTQKYQEILRREPEDGGITRVEALSYKDAGGRPRELRTLFVGTEFDDRIVEAVREVMLEAAGVMGGQIPNGLDAIAIFPERDSGHVPAACLGLGIDRQDPRSVLGLTYPDARLVEAKAPRVVNERTLADFKHTLRHEILGHILEREIAVYMATKFHQDMEDLTTGKRPPVQVAYAQVGPVSGTVSNVAFAANVRGQYRLINSASQVGKGGFPTAYALSSEHELTAECAVAMTGGIPTGELKKIHDRGAMAPGIQERRYRTDIETARAMADALQVGLDGFALVIPAPEGATWHSGAAENDPVVSRMQRRARELSHPGENALVPIPEFTPVFEPGRSGPVQTL